MQTAARAKQTTKEKRNPLLDQVKHTGLTHFKPNVALITTNRNINEGRKNSRLAGDENGDKDFEDDDDDDDVENPTISGRLKAISDRYLKSSTHRFLAKFYKNPSAKTDKSTVAESGEPYADKNKLNKVGKVAGEIKNIPVKWFPVEKKRYDLYGKTLSRHFDKAALRTSLVL